MLITNKIAKKNTPPIQSSLNKHRMVFIINSMRYHKLQDQSKKMEKKTRGNINYMFVDVCAIM